MVGPPEMPTTHESPETHFGNPKNVKRQKNMQK
jgi:hypothetical protein